MPEIEVAEVQLSNEAANDFANNPENVDDSDLLIFANAAGSSNDPAIAAKIQQALNAAAAGKLSNAVSTDADGNTVGGQDGTKLDSLH